MKVTIDYTGNFTFEGDIADLHQIYIAMDNWLTNLCFGERWQQNETAQTQWRSRVQEITERIDDAFNTFEMVGDVKKLTQMPENKDEG